MPIQLKCNCGKVVSVRDEMAGKAVKCPACQSVIRVPVTAAAKPPAPALDDFGVGSMDDLFNEAGFEVRTGKACPSCFEAIAADAVFCTKCGFHLETGSKARAHISDYEDAQSGDALLRKAAKDLELAKKMQDKMNAGAGMPWWMLALILFMLASVTGVGVIAVNLAKREDATTEFNALQTLMLLGGIGVSVVGCGAFAVVLYKACMESPKEGLMTLFIPFYIFYYGFTRFEAAGKPTILGIIASGVGGGLLVAATMQRG